MSGTPTFGPWPPFGNAKLLGFFSFNAAGTLLQSSKLASGSPLCSATAKSADGVYTFTLNVAPTEAALLAQMIGGGTGRFWTVGPGFTIQSYAGDNTAVDAAFFVCVFATTATQT